MQFMIVPVLAAGVFAMLRGGKLKNLAKLDLELSWLPLAMFAIQFGFVLFPLGQGESYFKIVPWITVSTYALLIVFLWVNRQLRGLKLILLGAVLNLFVILANGGFMPVSREALTRSGHMDKVFIVGDKAYVLGSKDVVLTPEQTRLLALSDVLKVPGPIEIPVTFSIGDVLIVMGASWLAYRAILDGVNDRGTEHLDTELVTGGRDTRKAGDY
jgi:hypothetical protein